MFNSAGPLATPRPLYNLTASDIMQKDDLVLNYNDVKILDILKILTKIPKKSILTIPIINSNGNIVKTILPKHLFVFIYEKYMNIKKLYNYKIQCYYNELFRYIKKKLFLEKKNFISGIKYKFKKLYLKMFDKDKLVKNKNFVHESAMRILNFFEDNMKKDPMFLNVKVDFEDTNIQSTKSALSIDKNYPLLKIQFLFTFLNKSHIFVSDSGKLIGVITKEMFINKTK